jgi:hypothetical protein
VFTTAIAAPFTTTDSSRRTVAHSATTKTVASSATAFVM